MRNVLILLAASAAALPLGNLAAAEVGIAATGPVVELTVYESIDIAPDTATVGAGVTTEATSASEAMRQNSAAMQKVIARLKTLGIAEKDIQTAGINLNANYEYDQATSRQVFRGYRASNTVSVILRKIDDTGKVLDALVEAGANDLSGPYFSIENDTEAKILARKRAVERAQAQARDYAKMLGYADIRVLMINEALEGRGSMDAKRGGEFGFVQAMSTEAPVQPGMVSTGVALSISFELVGNPAAGSK
ncbi:SIMPL domain-containing protein [Erythrobacter sp. BLCC-B19]|uniref:SIMPL domain-containing protein n=1 Tax=Erythrobacter sp. BLCC-B19 TaxID=3025315 RepID=UPI002360B706|nr:SIMPL domain-containing protein [Erythrobacter sp. BLCC-B19]WDA40231.1 SIMPL domain-containing protein [Erythrobacter sp. BLCC-B19]